MPGWVEVLEAAGEWHMTPRDLGGGTDLLWFLRRRVYVQARNKYRK